MQTLCLLESWGVGIGQEGVMTDLSYCWVFFPPLRRKSLLRRVRALKHLLPLLTSSHTVPLGHLKGLNKNEGEREERVKREGENKQRENPLWSPTLAGVLGSNDPQPGEEDIKWNGSRSHIHNRQVRGCMLREKTKGKTENIYKNSRSVGSTNERITKVSTPPPFLHGGNSFHASDQEMPSKS